MSSRSTAPRRSTGSVLLGLALALAFAPGHVAATGGTGSARDAAPAADETQYAYRFLSSPDFLNADVGDTRESPFHRPGDPNSTNRRYEKALRTVLDAFAAEYAAGEPRDLLVAGDLVNGHWGLDTDGTGIFGPTGTDDERVAAVRRAGRLYYSQWVDRFAERDITPYAAIGDHELGDDPWGRPGGGTPAAYNAFKMRALDVFKSTFSRHVLGRGRGSVSSDRPRGPAHRTAYAVRPHPEVQLVTLDVFEQRPGGVGIELDRRQLRWLRAVLREADRDGVDWTVVQGHTPILGPVRMIGSSGLSYEQGRHSRLWRLLREEGVDLYLAGEVHDVTAHQRRRGDPVQITHGGLFAYGGTNYLVADVTPDALTLTAKSFRSRVADPRRHPMWQTDNDRVVRAPGSALKSVPGWVHYRPTPYVTGRLTLAGDGTILHRSGSLDVYRG